MKKDCFAFRMPRSLHRRASAIAVKKGVSLDTFLSECIEIKIGAKSDPLLKEIEKQIPVWPIFITMST